MKNILYSILLLFPMVAHTQTNIRAWYAQGQVWILWNTQSPYPETYAIYKSEQPFTQADQATIIGRPFAYEYLPGTFAVQTGDPDFRYKVPKPDGSIYELGKNEALFVATTEQTESTYYGVVEWGNTAFTSGINLTTAAVHSIYDPINDPVTCYLQYTNILPTGHKANWYNIWLLGKQNLNDGRPDYPVMANAYKNGMPSMFIVSEAINMDTTAGKLIPVTHWLHGAGGTANGTVASQFKAFNIAPLKGISVSHNDDFFQLIFYENSIVGTTSRTVWFGYTKRHNPFDPNFHAAPGDTIINYTQRRILWINNWLIRNYHADRDHIALQGYSMGSGGVSALAKAYPDLFSTVCAFNNGFRRVDEETVISIHGTIEDNLPTNIRDRNNKNIGINQVFDMNTPLSSQRDLPLFRTWAGKNDQNGRMHWGPDLVAQYRVADSLGWGMQISWDERPHTYDTLLYHWIFGKLPLLQTYRDDLGYQELFSNKQSFPAFFNHRLDPKNNDPGTGVQGINMGDGDDWGTWGGYHNWDLQTIMDEPEKWEVTAWLTYNAEFQNDICPYDFLTSDVAIRRPQQFKPGPGVHLDWKVTDDNTGLVLQSGSLITGPDSLVTIPNVSVYVSGIRRVHISVEYESTAIEEVAQNESPVRDMKIVPNPSGRDAYLWVFATTDKDCELTLSQSGLRMGDINVHLNEGLNQISLQSFDDIPQGLYFIQLRDDKHNNWVKWVKSDD